MGSGATEIGKLIARSIGAEYVDREIIARIAEKVNREGKEIAAKEMPPGSFLGRLVDSVAGAASRGAGYQTIYLDTYEMPLEDAEYISALTDVVKNLAETPSVVIRGRGSEFILKDHPGSLHALIVAPLDLRVKCVAQTLHGDEQAAKNDIERSDASRREFIRHYFHANLEDPVHYDLVVNTARFTYKAAASIIVKALRRRQQVAGG